MNEINIDASANTIVYKARLHFILFFWPAILLCVAAYIAIAFPQLRIPSLVIGFCALLWEGMAVLTYMTSYLIIKSKQVILCTGVLIRQTTDIPINKVECVDIRQSIMGSLFNYGTLVITGSGGSRQVVSYLSKPLTSRRYIEQLMHG